ncbi:hypothetical protein [Erwinia sp.]|uniref:hypothetical protein n=1 Tax=Erwinia citreus TaxID=558 RepID=UPI003C71FCD7
MLKRESIEAALIATMQKQGQGLNGQDCLIIRTGISSTLAAQRRRCERERSASATFNWQKPTAFRRR